MFQIIFNQLYSIEIISLIENYPQLQTTQSLMIIIYFLLFTNSMKIIEKNNKNNFNIFTLYHHHGSYLKILHYSQSQVGMQIRLQYFIMIPQFYYFCLDSDIFNTMIIKKLLSNTLSPLRLLNRWQNRFSNHKFSYGQGGQLTLGLSKRSYNIFVKTIWEDYSELEIQGLTGPQSFTINSDHKIANFKDDDLQSNHSEEIKVSLNIPEDYTIHGVVNGHITHQQGDVGKKMRSNPFKLEVTGPHNLTLGDVTTQKINIINKEGSCSISSLTVETGLIESNKFQCKKLMTSSEIQINSKIIQIRSLIAFGKSRAKLNCQHLEIEGISGATEIIADTLKVKRYYGGQNDINIQCKIISEILGIETGTGKIVFSSQEEATSALPLIKLGFMHKGSLKQEGNIISIL